MEINPNRNVSPVNPIATAAKAKGASGTGSVDGAASFEQSSSLSAALSGTPDTRPSVVARAEQLVATASYPPREVINRIANLLAANLIVQA